MWRTPRCASASTTAFAIAGGASFGAERMMRRGRFTGKTQTFVLYIVRGIEFNRVWLCGGGRGVLFCERTPVTFPSRFQFLHELNERGVCTDRIEERIAHTQRVIWLSRISGDAQPLHRFPTVTTERAHPRHGVRGMMKASQ